MVDTRGLSCPIPVVMVQQAIKKDAPAKLEVLADAKVAVENITRLATTNGYQVSVVEDGLDFKLTLTK
ncbi:sulfurtransferase TusA family protein [Dysosmobacter sp.]|uniref:sulfurtransferase TusA family protein n=1 Tax=Dysosmobacter sp. TaxID=2591382 RepID=UPI002A9A049E|nr:sulfurtransferase TusA family protein [Dysosmobacter sp.]MDY5611592.1 sulfurtransferase TusA family protein [Dysosmobacter sp.]